MNTTPTLNSCPCSTCQPLPETPFVYRTVLLPLSNGDKVPFPWPKLLPLPPIVYIVEKASMDVMTLAGHKRIQLLETVRKAHLMKRRKQN